MHRYAFETLGFVRVSAQIAEDNHASGHLAEKLGFELHAILPQANLGGKVVDVAYYSLANGPASLWAFQPNGE